MRYDYITHKPSLFGTNDDFETNEHISVFFFLFFRTIFILTSSNIPLTPLRSNGPTRATTSTVRTVPYSCATTTTRRVVTGNQPASRIDATARRTQRPTTTTSKPRGSDRKRTKPRNQATNRRKRKRPLNPS